MTSETLDKRTALLPRLLADRPRIWRVGVVLLGSWLLAAASWAEIPMVPVPMTLQTYALFVIAALAGRYLAAAIVVVWLFQAAIGFPGAGRRRRRLQALGPDHRLPGRHAGRGADHRRVRRDPARLGRADR